LLWFLLKGHLRFCLCYFRHFNFFYWSLTCANDLCEKASSSPINSLLYDLIPNFISTVDLCHQLAVLIVFLVHLVLIKVPKLYLGSTRGCQSTCLVSPSSLNVVQALLHLSFSSFLILVNWGRAGYLSLRVLFCLTPLRNGHHLKSLFIFFIRW
jgi:hypothetical protein